MERPQIYFFLLPLSIITLILYFKMLFVLWKRRDNYNTLFYKLIWTQSVFDISYVIVFFVFEIPQDWPSMYEYVLNLNSTHWVQLMYAHAYVCVIGQILGVTLNSIGRVLMVRFSTKSISTTIDELSALTVVLIHFTPPVVFGLYLFFGQTPSRFEFVPSLNRMTRVTNVNYVRINSMFSIIISITAALISSFCYFLIFRTLKQRPFRSWNREASILCSSFVLFLCLCALSLYFLSNGLLSIFNWNAMFALRMHYYAFSFPISLLNPWCLLLTSARMRNDVLGKCLSETAVMRLLPNRTHSTHGTAAPKEYLIGPVQMELERPQLYYFLLPFTIISLFLYIQILYEIYHKRGFIIYDSFFYRMICSQSLYDISYVIMYFVMEIPQDWPSMYDFLLGMNGTVLPQLTLGVTMMAVSRMMLVCHPTYCLTKNLKHLSVKEVMFFHLVIPAIYACYIIIAQDWRSYDFVYKANRVTRVGSEESIALNSNIICASSFTGALVSAMCYIRVFVALRKRPLRSWRSEISILVTSFVLFCALCTLAAYFVCNLLFVGSDWSVFYTIRKHFYAFSFFISLANPWCLMITSESMRSSIVHRCLPSFLIRLPLCSRFFPLTKTTANGESSVNGANNRVAPKQVFTTAM